MLVVLIAVSLLVWKETHGDATSSSAAARRTRSLLCPRGILMSMVYDVVVSIPMLAICNK